MAGEVVTGANDWSDVDQMARDAELFANGHGGYPEAPAEVVLSVRELAGMRGAAILLDETKPVRVPDSSERVGSDNFIG